MEVYCMKCKKRDVINVVEKEVLDTKKGAKYLLRGTCGSCSTNVCKLVNESTFNEV